MRIKKDSLIKYMQLANTMYLTNEEFGALIRKTMLDDDTNGYRYENLDDETVNDLKEFEQQWLYDYQRLRKKNPMVAGANATVGSQVKHSTKAFYDQQERINKNKEENGKPETPVVDVPEAPVVDVPEAPKEEKIETEDFWLQGNDIAFTPRAAELIQNLGYDIEEVAKYIDQNAGRLILPFSPVSIEEVLGEMK